MLTMVGRILEAEGCEIKVIRKTGQRWECLLLGKFSFVHMLLDNLDAQRFCCSSSNCYGEQSVEGL